MKLRCAYCNHVFSEPTTRCPSCGRILRLPPALRQRSLREREKARERIAREAEKRRRRRLEIPGAGRRSPAVLFAVILILMVAGGLLVGRLNQTVTPVTAPRTRTDIAHDELRTLRIALERFKIDQGRYPTEEEGLTALVRDPGNLPAWERHYITLLKPDPWGHDYHYAVRDDAVIIRSAGPDRTLHTDADILAPPVTPEEVDWPAAVDDL